MRVSVPSTSPLHALCLGSGVALLLLASGCGSSTQPAGTGGGASPGAQAAGPGALTIDTLVAIEHPSSPVWSPDGQQVAFLSDRAGVINVMVADVDGKSASPRAVTHDKAGQPPPAGLFWSTDSQIVYFSRGGDLWKVAAGGSGAAEAAWTTPTPESGITPSPDGTKVAFIRPADGGTAPLPPTAGGGTPLAAESSRAGGGAGRGAGATGAGTATAGAAAAPAGGRRGGAGAATLFVRTLADGKETKVAENPLGIGAVAWSPDGARLAFTSAGTTRHEEAPGYSGAKILYTYQERTTSDIFVASTAGGGQPVAIAQTPESESSPRWVDATHLVLERQTDRYKKRQILIADATNGQAKVAYEEVDEKWLSMPGDSGNSANPSPDGRWIAFLSDRDGWDHLYVMPAAGGAPVQVTHGSFEVWRPTWSKDSTRIAYDANSAETPGVRHVSVVSIAAMGVADSSSAGAGASAAAGPAGAAGAAAAPTTVENVPVKAVTNGRGTNIAAVWAPDGKQIAYQHTDPQHSAELEVSAAPPGDASSSAMTNAAPIQLSNSMPGDVDRSRFVEPELIHYPGPDGAQVPAYLFVPKGLDRSKKHPAIVWIHGDGVNMNYDGWHVQRNYAVYYSMHQYLLQKGYVVLAPDYGGSIGYGKAWRQRVHMDVGGKDFQDAALSADYLKKLPYVDGNHIGVWGLSYGGFFTLLALTDHPTSFAAGIDVAGVVDYRMYYNDPYHGGWTVGRIGTPEENPKVYDQASPLSRADKIVKPLLILHGTADVNVPYLQSVRLVDELLRLRKPFEYMMYPGEFHYFTREHVLRDAWTRVEAFFGKHLKGQAAATS